MKRYLTTLMLVALMTLSSAITEDDNVVGLRDANISRERPRIDAYDIDEAT